MSKPGLSGTQIAAINLKRFNAWIAERDAAGDWSDYLRQEKLNRSTVATECGFALSVLRQNPAVKEMLESLENRLLASGVLLAKKSDRQTTNEPKDAPILEESDQCIQFSKASTDRRVKAVEEQNAVLKAENRELREQLRQYKFLDEHLSSTGRKLYR